MWMHKGCRGMDAGLQGCRKAAMDEYIDMWMHKGCRGMDGGLQGCVFSITRESFAIN